jgi:hypothetical protein
VAAVALGATTLPEVAERPAWTAGGGQALSRLWPAACSTARPARATGSAPRPSGRRPSARPAEAEPGREESGDEVLRRFIHRGRLLAMPAAYGKRLVVLDHLAGLFEPGGATPSRRSTSCWGATTPDYAMLRRYLVDDGFLDRADEPAPSGSRSVKVYWRTGGTVDLAAPTSS